MDYATARHNMVEGQIRPNGITDPAVVAALETIPRELFVPKHMRGIAYADDDLDLGNGRCLMHAMVLARLLQSAAVEPTDVALDVAPGSGYSTAVLSRLAQTVVAVEPDADFNARCSTVMNELSIDNVAVMSEPLTQGCPQQGPYDVIMINGAVEEVPQTLLDQLADGGRLVCVLIERGQGRVTVFTRHGQAFGRRYEFDANVPLLPGFTKPAGFVF